MKITNYFLILLIFNLNLFAQKEKEVSLQLLWKHQFEFAGFYIAKEKGFYKEYGLNVEFKEFDFGVDITKSIETSKSTFGVAYPNIILDKSNGSKVVLLNAIYQSSPHVLISLKSSGINSLKDFKDKKIMIENNAIKTAPLLSMLYSENIKLSNMKIIKPSFTINDLIDNKVDIFSAYISNEVYKLDKQNIKYNIWNPSDYGFDFYNNILFTSEETLKNNPTMVKNFQSASLKGWEYAFENMEEAIDLVLEKYNTQNKTRESLTYEANTLKKLAYKNDKKLGDISIEKIQRIYDIYNLMGLTKNKIDLDDFIYKPDNKKIMLSPEEKVYLKNNNTITVHNELNWPPYNFNINGVAKGFSIDYMNLIASKLNLNVEYIHGPNWSEFMNMIKENKIDVMLNIRNTAKRSEFINFTKKYIEASKTIFTNYPNINSLSDLNGKTVAVPKEFFIHKFLEKEFPEIKLNIKDDIYACIVSVIEGQSDAIVADFGVTRYLLQDKGFSFDYITVVKDKRLTTKMNIGTPINNPILRDILQKSMNSITHQELSDLKNRWLGINISKTNTNKYNNINLTNIEKNYLKEKKEISMCIDPDWMPFEKLEDGKYIGISSDYFKLFEKSLNINFNLIKTNSWNESLEFAKQRKCDILTLAMETNERKNYMNFTEPYLKIPLVISTKISVPFINDISALEDEKIGIPKGYAFVEILKNKYPKLNIIEVKNVNDGLKRVNSGELFGYIGTLASVGYMFQSEFTGELKITGKFDEKWELGVAVRNDDMILLNIFNKVVKSIDKAKRQQILNNWVAIKYEESFDKTLIINILIIVFLIIIFFLYKQYNLRKSINEFNEVINATMEGILIFKDGICIDANQSTLDIFGYKTKDEVIGKIPLDFISKESREYVKEQFKEVEALPYEAKLIRKDGTKFYGLIRGQNLKNKNVRLSSVIDISTLKQQETALIEQSRMVAMGEMIGNIAHQWRQPLSVISTGATGLQIQKEYDMLTDELFDETCEAINKNAQYLSKTIDDFKNFIKGDRKKIRFNLKDNIDSFIKLVEGSIKSNHIHLISTIGEKIYIDGYPNELIQCYINIFNNSKDVLKDIDEDRLIFISCDIKKESIVITIKDNGGGIPDDIILKIFDPYFTTKHKSQGTGLGLHMTYNLIKDGMNGNIEAKNIEYKYDNINYKGAEFKITLPKQDDK